MEDLDLNAVQWDWITGDGSLDYEILYVERLPLPPSMDVQSGYQNWAQTLHSATTDNLRGCSPVEVSQEAARIKLGSTFSCFEEFDRCLDSWCVLNGRSSHRYANKFSFCLKMCRCGPLVRPPWWNLAIGSR